MSPTTLPVLCGAALAIMAGAAATHHHSVRQLVELADTDPDFAGGSRPIASAAPASEADTLAAIREIRRQNASLQEALQRQKSVAGAPADPDMKRLLAELVEQNKFLHDQVAETNRDLMDIQFRVDTHSEQFRPLKVAEEITYDDSIGVLPPRDIN